MKTHLYILLFLGLLTSCGQTLRGKRILPKGEGFGIQGLSNITTSEGLRKMEGAFNDRLPELEIPNDGETAIFKMTFAQEQMQQFRPSESADFECHFSFHEMELTETMHLVVNENKTSIEKTIKKVPLNPVYHSTLAMESRRKTCLENIGKLNATQRVSVDLEVNYQKLAQYMDHHFFKVIRACQNSGDLEYGKCLGGNLMEITHKKDAIINHYKAELFVSFSKNNQKIEKQVGFEVSAKHVYFSNLGIMNQIGDLPRPANDGVLGTTNIQLIRYRN